MTAGALIVALLAAIGSAIAAAVHGPVAVIGWLAAIVALAIAFACASAAKALHDPDDLTEARHDRGPSEPFPQDVLDRRTAIGGMWGFAVAALTILGIIPLVALARRPARGGTAWFRGARLVTEAGDPVRAGDLTVGSIATVFPEGHIGAPESATLLLRLESDALRVTPDRAGWAPQGNVAYSKICTHAGCPVAIYRQASYELYCPCHQSVFDVLDEARPVSGPATRPLPQLALDVDADGYLVAQGDYTEPVGPDSWWRTI
ncbi:MAG TPA: Rieske 2Fe-2S domain-containing protein [Candidatus Acidoferrales bacterium]|nr:Rieske 2Fe-2S domain-containing protein [Candidatus Acidoferrales bacterium]